MNSCMPLALPVIRPRKSARPMRMVTRGLSARPLSISQRPSAMRMAYSWAPSGALISYWTTACWPAALSGLNDSDMPAKTWSSTPATPPSCCWMAPTSSSLELRSTASFSDEKSEASIWLMGRPPCSAATASRGGRVPRSLRDRTAAPSSVLVRSVESGEAEAGDLPGLPAGGDPGGQRSAGGRGHEQAVTVMAGAHPGVVEAGNSVDHGLTVGGGWAKAAPLVAQPHLAGSREQLAQSTPDALDDLGADLGGVVALVAGAAGQQPTIGHGPDPQARAVQAAGQPEADRLGHHQVAFDQPLRQPHPGFGGQPGGEHHHPRVQ